MLTEFGKFVRKLRIDTNGSLKCMALKLKVTSSHLSAIELGKRNIPIKWGEAITELYSLNEKKANKLNDAIYNSSLNIKICLKKYTEADRELLILFKEKFSWLTESDKQEIRNILIERDRQAYHKLRGL